MVRPAAPGLEGGVARLLGDELLVERHRFRQEFPADGVEVARLELRVVGHGGERVLNGL